MTDDDALEVTLRETEDRLAWLEAEDATRRAAHQQAQATLRLISRHRQRGRVPMWEAAQRAALRMAVLAAGCVLIVAGATALDGTLGGAAIVLSFGVLVFEGSR